MIEPVRVTVTDLQTGKTKPLRPRTPTMEQDPDVIELARKIHRKWMDDPRYARRPSSQPIAYFWAELAARAALEK